MVKSGGFLGSIPAWVWVVLSLAAVAVVAVACSSADFVKTTVPAPIAKELGMSADQRRVPLSALDSIETEYKSRLEAKVEAVKAAAEAKSRALSSQLTRSQRTWAAELERVKVSAAAELAELGEQMDSATAEATAAGKAIESETKRAMAAMVEVRTKAEEKAAAIDNLLSGGLNLIAPALSTALPGSGAILTLAAGAFGLMTRKPGDAASMAQADAKRAEDAAKQKADHAAEIASIKDQAQKAIDSAWTEGASEARRNSREGILNTVLAANSAPAQAVAALAGGAAAVSSKAA